MKRSLLLIPFLGLTAFAGYYHHWNTAQLTAEQSARPATPDGDYRGRNGRREAEVDLALGRRTVLTYGLPVHWTQEYREVLLADYGLELRATAGCVVTESLMEYSRAYNEVMERDICQNFGADAFGRAAQKAIALYDRRHPAAAD